MSDKGNHWYRSDGTPQHTIVGKNGKERAPRVKEAMDLGLFPSVTTKLSVIANHALNDWKMDEVAKRAWEVRPNDGEAIEAYAKRIKTEAMEQVSDAADLGTRIHDALERYFQGETYPTDLAAYVSAVDGWVKDNKIKFLAHELRLVNKEIGYAGTTDAAFDCPKGFGILDFKSRKTNPGEKVKAYETQVMQIAAYHVCHWGPISTDLERPPIGCNLYISTTEPGRVEAVWYDAAELEDAWRAFLHASRLWDYLKGYEI